MRYFEYGGERLTAKEISARTGIRAQTFRDRLHKGWSVSEAAETMVMSSKRKAARDEAKLLADAAREERLKGMSREEAVRYKAAESIATEICGGVTDEFGFRCSIPQVEYLFESNILGWRIRFAPDGKTASLTARYLRNGFDSDFNRLYAISGTKVKEVHPI